MSDGNVLRVLYVGPGVGHAGMNGSRRYLDLLRAGSAQSAERTFIPEVLEAPHHKPFLSLREKLMLGSWALTGRPQVAIRPGPTRPALVHSVENVSVPRSGSLPLVVTVHDLSALVRPDLVGKRVALLARLSWRRARSWDAIIVPSEATRSDVVAMGIPRRQTRLIRYGVSAVFTRVPSEDAMKAANQISGGRPFVLAVCPVSVKKGADTLIKSWSQAATAVDGRLVWVSGSKGAEEERILNRGPALSDDRLVRIRNLSDEVLAALYRQARALIAPSRWEGYSFPVAEALASGTQVIASDIPVHREFGDDQHVHFFGPERPADLADLLISAFRSDVRGIGRAFPPAEDFVRAHGDLYREVTS